MSLQTFANAVENVRLDARAGFTRCTPGKTVPCGRTCRQPKNCAKGKGTQERKSRIGEENLQEFRDAKRSQLKAKRQGREGAKSTAGKMIKLPTVKREEPSLDDPFLTPWLEKGEVSAADVKRMVRDRLKKPPTEADFDRWARIQTYAEFPGKDNRDRGIKARQFMYDLLDSSTSEGAIKAEEEKLKRARTDKSREKIQKNIDGMKRTRELNLQEAEQFYGKNVDPEGVLNDLIGDRVHEYRDFFNKHYSSGRGDRTMSAYAMIGASLGLDKNEIKFEYDYEGEDAARDRIQDAINKTPGRSLLPIKGVPSSADELRKAYRSAAMVHHPDRGGDANKFRRLTSEYETLKQRYGFDSLLMRLDSLRERYANYPH